MTALLVFILLQSGNPKYFKPFLKPRHSLYNTQTSQTDGDKGEGSSKFRSPEAMLCVNLWSRAIE